MTLTVGSLFSGIGGFDLGLERAGMKVIWNCEIDPYACRLLKKHWPDVPNIGNIKEVNWNEITRPNVLCGGYPCQPFSTAGKRQGENDPRHLWPYFRDAISVLRPRYAILENVRGHLTLGGTTVIGDLAAIGYNAEWRVISAASVGANHRRDRIIIVAYPHRSPVELKCQRQIQKSNAQRRSQNVSDTSSGDGRGAEPYGLCEVFGQAAELRESDSAIGSLPNWWKIEPDVGRVADGIPSRVDRLRGIGNAVVPQVAEYIGRIVIAHDLRT